MGASGATVPFTLGFGDCAPPGDNFCRFLAGSPSRTEPGLAGVEWTGGRGTTRMGEDGDIVGSPRDDGVLFLGVGCWGVKCGRLPAVLRLRIGRSLSVSNDSSFFGFGASVGG